MIHAICLVHHVRVRALTAMTARPVLVGTTSLATQFVQTAGLWMALTVLFVTVNAQSAKELQLTVRLAS